ncbi:hypothetical protein [Pseudoalteromonas luteoviolacea]|uniref:Outer membrane protein beta-barrel domain-containing protein n=1 Tax=Pseudoalteromonas luteoviolacea S4054 TaxID=1129367 RepID=A0A0F6A5E8_9GAMM|nr:hypothetical protein [Pseudoalteromonas luteoviolacea]AOT07580.1 hypothetical protein S4054249_06880 [Pseudoalteromonas luteoviolacea]AOT12496.1 hypothetical protein S40542_06880 [Pseudoalteromonas luteoviolacea]AOT17410.1 hypothetical protein S4054_06880 [Pseudoalteromonas luteoviolacea]KKE81318.1 hypothetical protein N479_22545 [Pseudoalteromonas luteoviolacea S4054]KZN70673.1 hypothetical protein N481_20890 [Pseudoalteromonas luteoviolacea S4047-1]
MRKKILPIAMVLSSFSAFSAEFEFATGIGSQYAGVLGVQAAVKVDNSRYFAALGLIGVTAGAQFQIPDKPHHSMGVNFGRFYGVFNDDTDFLGLTYNYHFNGFHNSGWEIGTGISYFRTDEYHALFGHKKHEEEREVGLLFNIGYKF